MSAPWVANWSCPHGLETRAGSEAFEGATKNHFASSLWGPWRRAEKTMALAKLILDLSQYMVAPVTGMGA